MTTKEARRLRRHLREAVSTTSFPELKRGKGDTLDSSKDLEEAKLTTKQRKGLSKSSFAIPEKAPGSGSYPIPDESHARNALSRVAQHGTPEEKARVRRAVKRKYPSIGEADTGDTDDDESQEPDEDKDDVEEAAPDEKLVLKRATAKKGRRQESAPQPRPLHIRVRELKRSGDVYECTIIREGPGNERDRNYYTRESLKDAVNRRLFEGLQAYANHPTASEERERPERDIRQLVGHFREAQYVDGQRGEVRAKFIPIDGAGFEWVRSLVEAAINGDPERPLIGISIDGYGHAPDQQEIGGRKFNMVREIASLPSADLVTRAGAGGRFHRRLSEAFKYSNPGTLPGSTTGGGRMKPAEMQEKIREALSQLERGSRDDDGDAIEGAIATLRECADAEIKRPVKIVEREVPAGADDNVVDLTRRLQETEERASGAEKRARNAEGRLDAMEHGRLAAKVLRESDLPEAVLKAWFEDVALQESEQAMREFVERKKAERDSILAEVRESYGIEGAGPRQPAGAGVPQGQDLYALMGLED